VSERIKKGNRSIITVYYGTINKDEHLLRQNKCWDEQNGKQPAIRDKMISG
jgi:hypothetical protein